MPMALPYPLELDRINIEYSRRERDINSRYDGLMSDGRHMRQAYAAYMGYKIAWGFSRNKGGFMPVYTAMVEKGRKEALRRNAKARSQALYRAALGRDGEFLNALLEENATYFPGGIYELESGVFFTIGGGALIEHMETAASVGKVILGVYDGWQSNMDIYRSSVFADLAIRKLMRKCQSWQKKGISKYPYVIMRSGIPSIPDVYYFVAAAFPV